MTEARYHELLGQLLDGVLADADAAALRQELESDPDRLRDVREHLALSELLAQEHAPGRSADGFWRSLESRLNAGTRDDDPLESTDAFGRNHDLRRRRSLAAAAVAAGLLLALGVGVRWRGRPGERDELAPARSLGVLGSPTAGVKRVSLHGEVVCVHCLLHEADACRSVVRVHEQGRVATISLSDNDVCREFYRREGCGRTPLPVLAEGIVRTENGRSRLAVTRLEVQR